MLPSPNDPLTGLKQETFLTKFITQGACLAFYVSKELQPNFDSPIKLEFSLWDAEMAADSEWWAYGGLEVSKSEGKLVVLLTVSGEGCGSLRFEDEDLILDDIDLEDDIDEVIETLSAHFAAQLYSTTEQ
jgi:hypothetical protein